MNKKRLNTTYCHLNVSLAHVEQNSGSWKAGPATYAFNQPSDVSVK